MYISNSCIHFSLHTAIVIDHTLMKALHCSTCSNCSLQSLPDMHSSLLPLSALLTYSNSPIGPIWLLPPSSPAQCVAASLFSLPSSPCHPQTSACLHNVPVECHFPNTLCTCFLLHSTSKTLKSYGDSVHPRLTPLLTIHHCDSIPSIFLLVLTP